MNEVTLKENIKIENLIYEIRGKQVMLDSDLAKLYGCKNGTKTINLAVKRNVERFPNDFYFQLNREEYHKILRFQIETLELEQGKYSKYLPYVFTEQGVAMLASVLDETFHDRYFILDNKDIYLSGASVNRIGYKTSTIVLLNDKDMCSLLIDKVNKIFSTNSI